MEIHKRLREQSLLRSWQRLSQIDVDEERSIVTRMAEMRDETTTANAFRSSSST